MSVEKLQMDVDWEWVEAESGEWFDSHEPYSGDAWVRVPRGTAEDAAMAVEAAHRASDNGCRSGLTATDRGARLRRFAALVERAAGRLGAIEHPPDREAGVGSSAIRASSSPGSAARSATSPSGAA